MSEAVRYNDRVLGLPRQIWAYAAVIFLIIFFFWDVGNLLAPRQGTESLYVQISKEMFETSNYLSPVYRGENHWSKPPLQYWLPMPFYALFGGFSLTAARMTMGVISLIASLTIVFFLTRQKIKLNPSKAIIIILSSFGILKFSRTFMMEIPFALLPLISSLCFFDYLETRKMKMLIIAVVTMAAGALVKGPVSLIMGIASLSLYSVISWRYFKKLIILDVLKLFLASVLLSSIWYLLCYQKFGQEFIQYFFFRENLGKFGQKESMSSVKLIQGLFLFTFPWLHLINTRQLKRKLSNPFYIFILSHFLIFFFIWFIPSQKSHHYAMPGFAFWLVLIMGNPKSFVRDRFSRFLFWFQIVLLLLISIIFLYFSNNLLDLALALVPIIFLLFSIKLNVSTYGMGISFVVLYTAIATRFYLPLMPNKGVESLLTNTQASIHYNDRRPFFLEQRLGRKVEVYDPSQVKKGDYIITPMKRGLDIPLTKVDLIFSWEKWKRKVRRKDIYQAISQRNLKYLKSSYVLYESI